MTTRLGLSMAIAIGLLATVVPERCGQASGPVLGAKRGNAVDYNGFGQGVYGGRHYDT